MDDIADMLSKWGTVVSLAFFLLPMQGVAQNLQLADSLASIGSDYNDQGNYEEAEFYLSEALEIYQQHPLQDTSQFIDITIDFSNALYQRARYNEALKRLEEIKPLVEHANDTTQLINFHNFRGLILKNQNHFEAALDRYNEALQLASHHQDSVWMAILYDNMGGVSRQVGNYEKSLEYRRQALGLFEKVGNDLNLSITLNNIGLTYIQLSMYDRAYEYLSESLSMSKDIGNTARLTSAYTNMGMVHHNMGNYDQAMVSYQKALTNARKTGNPVKQGHVLVNLGNLYNQLGDIRRSLEYYQESLKLVLEHNVTSPTELSTKYKNIAARQMDLGKVEEARQNYRQALELRKKIGDIREVAHSYLDIAQLERRRGAYEGAIDFATRSREIADSIGIRELLIEAETELGNIQRGIGNARPAILHYKVAYRQSVLLSGRQSLKPLSLLAHTFDDIESDSAVYYGKKLVDIIENNRSSVGELSSLKSGYFEGYVDFYENLASWMLKYRNDKEQAFELVEASRARALLDELVLATQNLDETLPVDTRLKKQRLQEAIQNCQSSIDTTADPQEKQMLQKKLRNLELEYASFMNQVRTGNPAYKKLEFPTPVSAFEARELVNDDTAILEYAFVNNELLIFLITAGDIRVKQVDIAKETRDSERMTQLVERFRDQILAHQPEEKIQAESKKLFRYLVQPFYTELSGYANLMIIPDEALTYLPFEALTVQNQYLVEQFSIKYVPSMTTFSLLKDKKEQHISHNDELLAIAGSNFGGTSSPLNRGEAYPPLPATIAEVDSIASKFNSAQVFKEGNFREQFIKESLSKSYRYIHLATHGIINEDYPNLSGLALSSAPEQASGKEDGMLRSSEIYQLDINSDLVVLSACNTGLGKMVDGEGMLGLQRSFFYAGVPTVSVSLWNVYDRSTAYFMDQFYSALLETVESQNSEWSWNTLLRWIGWDSSVPSGEAAPAMRQAKLTMLEHPLFNHPVYWAPFVVLGR